MNFRKLLTYLTVSTAAVIPFAGAQNPTILQGSYISNVFGNSNFVLNPNAQTNIANVTTVTATVTRSTTTPLVATSEFTVAIGTANGTATWATRTFDAGMKGQNCEARFTYRGFAATSKVNIKQNSNIVASLTLTPSATDPRIASINFPCGDLSTATTFVVTDTAILAGTNEIGGIYVGLATNMANVAQAENVVQAGRTGSQSFTTAETAIIFNTETKDVYGEFDTANGRFTAKRAGDYLVSSTWLSDLVSWTSGNFLQLALNKNTSNFCRNYSPIEQTQTMNRGITTTCVISLAVGDYIESRITQNQATMNSEPSAGYVFTSISRFPSSSELVVTPERQNTWAGVVYTAESQSLFSGTAEPTASTPFTNAVWNQPTKLKGKAAVTTTNSGNDLGFSVANLPVGNYKLEVTGLLAAEISSTVVGQVAECNFRLIETTTTTEIASQVQQDQQYGTVSNQVTRDYINAFTGVFNNTSVATRNFRIEAQKYQDQTSGNVSACQAFSSTSASSINTKIAIIMTPLDQPSNSALYVQGPVKAAATGAAIPAGYVGSVKSTTVENGLSYNTTASTITTLTVTPGVYIVTGMVYPRATITGARIWVDTSASGEPSSVALNLGRKQSIIDGDRVETQPFVLNVTGTTIYLRGATSIGTTTNAGASIYATQIN